MSLRRVVSIRGFFGFVVAIIFSVIAISSLPGSLAQYDMSYGSMPYGGSVMYGSSEAENGQIASVTAYDMASSDNSNGQESESAEYTGYSGIYPGEYISPLNPSNSEMDYSREYRDSIYYSGFGHEYVQPVREDLIMDLNRQDLGRHARIQ